MSSAIAVHPSSYRDPAGFVFGKDGIMYRQVNISFKDSFDRFLSSGLYQSLSDNGLLIPHENVPENLTGSADHYITIRPQQLEFVSYPYEWSFNMLKDAALLTLQLTKEAMKKGMILRDASPYNVQFRNGRPIFIDTLSFGIYNESQPWAAYRQFCECFAAPLLIAHHLSQPVHSLFVGYSDGIPLSFASAMLPHKTKWSLHTYLHIHLHARTGINKIGRPIKAFSRKKLENILDSLELLVSRCKLPAQASTWSEYYNEASTRNGYLDAKKAIITSWISALNFRTAADLGANNGLFARLVAEKKQICIAADADSHSIDDLYLQRIEGVFPLVVDLSTPSPAIGVNNNERTSLLDRLKNTELVLALALIHHLAVGKNIPFRLIAEMFRRICSKYLIIEYVPKDDEKVRLLLKDREDIFSNYGPAEFENSFLEYFMLVRKESISDSGRTIYLFERKPGQ